MDNNLISIIVPVYKVEKYLVNCIESILNQKHQNIELILVDDGSPDNCGIICDQYAIKDTRIKVIHKKNGGLSDARNVGLNYAKGEFIGFVDSDDHIHKDMFAILLENLIQYSADISICSYQKVTDFSQSNKEMRRKECIELSNTNALQSLYSDKLVEMVVAWNKLYRSEIFKDISYPIGKVHEDEFIIHYLLYRSNKVVYTDTPLYYYMQRKDSITGSGFDLKYVNKFEALEDRISFFNKIKFIDLYQLAFIQLLELIIEQYYEAKKSKIYKKECKFIKQYYDKKYSEYEIYFKNQKELRLTLKIFYYSPVGVFVCKEIKALLRNYIFKVRKQSIGKDKIY